MRREWLELWECYARRCAENLELFPGKHPERLKWTERLFRASSKRAAANSGRIGAYWLLPERYAVKFKLAPVGDAIAGVRVGSFLLDENDRYADREQMWETIRPLMT